MAIVGKGKEAVPFISELSDVGHFSYAALCAIRLRHLFGEAQHDKKFCQDFLHTVLVHVGASKQVKVSISAIMRGMGIQQKDPLVHSLLKDEALEKYGVMRVAEDLVMLAIKDGVYDSRNRVFIHDICDLLGLEWSQVESYEFSVVSSLHEEEHVLTEEEKKERDSKEKKRKIKRVALIGLATVGGGALLGLTGGLAAPLIAGGMGAVIGTAGATALASTAGVAIIGSLFGAAGAGLAGVKMKKRMGSLEEFEIETLTEGESLHTTVVISGWLNDICPDFKSAWLGLDDSAEQYTLRYESEYLTQMGKAMDYLMDIAINLAVTEALKYTVLAGVLAAIAWPLTLISAAAVIDNPWHVCMERSSQAGKQLAEILLARVQGKRPVTLIGFSIGARVIFYCLQEMSKRKNCEGIIENVVLLGAPVPGDAGTWKEFGRVVAGRIVNGYCGGDWLLKFLYRTANVQLKIAGLSPISWEDRRMENLDLSEMVEGHIDYMKKIDEILAVVGIKTKERPLPEDWEVVDEDKAGKSEVAKFDPEYFSVASVVKDTMGSKEKSENNQNIQIVNEQFQDLLGKAREERSEKDVLELNKVDNNNSQDKKSETNILVDEQKDNRSCGPMLGAACTTKDTFQLHDSITSNISGEKNAGYKKTCAVDNNYTDKFVLPINDQLSRCNSVTANGQCIIGSSHADQISDIPISRSISTNENTDIKATELTK